MAKVLFKGWRRGLRKISLTRLIQSYANLPLNEARAFTDKLLDGESFAFKIEDIEQAEEFAKAAEAIGAVCEIIKDND